MYPAPPATRTLGIAQLKEGKEIDFKKKNVKKLEIQLAKLRFSMTFFSSCSLHNRHSYVYDFIEQINVQIQSEEKKFIHNRLIYISKGFPELQSGVFAITLRNIVLPLL